VTGEAAYILYVIFALGAVGLYFLLPNPERRSAGVGAALGVLAVGALLVFLSQAIGASGYFYLFAGIAVLSAGRVVTHRKPVFSALYFVVAVIAVAALMVLLQAEFLAIALIIVYGGAILVTYLFVMMLAQQSGSPVYDVRAREPFAGVVAGFILMGAIAGQAGNLPEAKRPVTIPVTLTQSDGGSVPVAMDSHTLGIARVLMTKYVVVLELSGVLLLVSMVGAIALSRKQVPVDPYQTDAAPLGEVGKTVEPF
jgi:NADH-quinone oxidoreductase subunit J